MINELKLIVDYAYDNIPIYRKLYRQKPKIESIADFQKLPYIRLNDFFNCKIEDVISDVVDVVSILPPIENKSIFPFPRLESAHDRDMRYEIFYFLLEQMNVEENSSFVVLTDSTHSYFCGEIVTNLLFYKHPTSMIMIRDHSDSDITNWINKLQPDYLIIGTKRNFTDVSEWKVYSIIDINPPNSISQRGNFVFKNLEYHNIYTINEIGWIGISSNESGYIYPKDYFYIESDPADNILTITTLTSDMLPFIRYKTTDRCIITGENSFHITYIGEH